MLAMALTATAWAHAHLQRALPPAGSTVSTAPKEVSLWFTQQLEPGLSGLEVLDGAGSRVDKGDAHLAAKDTKQMLASLTDIAPGTYKVRWHVVSVDTHRTEGNYAFTVKP
ncbi:MAG: copper homeostasis periplasmic binding protein CopC [Proteobacteria bacterium]|nr:copper homeostasis periplasmic binding protein CopC [Pseudomonadota bacterium]MBI3497115.1 copper homeostasis periplasmic binding protein CopC [Pseudomonadota bacterium]